MYGSARLPRSDLFQVKTTMYRLRGRVCLLCILASVVDVTLGRASSSIQDLWVAYGGE